MATTTTKVSLKLLIDKKGNKVLFAEAGKDFVDFIFNILSLPVSTVISLLTKEGMVGCISNLYKSVENLNDSYIQPNQTKDTFLKPKAQLPLLSLNDAPAANTFYRCACEYNGPHYSDDTSSVCPNCRNKMTTKLIYKSPPAGGGSKKAVAGGGGFVKEVVTYMVMDDLEVAPMSTISVK